MVVGTMTDHLRPKPKIPIVRNKQATPTRHSIVRPKPRKNWAASVQRKKWPASVNKGKAKQQKLTKSMDEVPFSLQRGKITEYMRYKSALAVNEKPAFLMPPPPPRKRKCPEVEYEEPDDEYTEMASNRDAEDARRNKEIAMKKNVEEARKNKEKALEELEQLRSRTKEFITAINNLSEDYSQHQLTKAKLKVKIQRLDDEIAGHYEQEPVGVKYKPEWHIRDRLLHFQNTDDEGAVTIYGVNIRGMRVPDWLHNMLSHLNNNATGTSCVHKFIQHDKTIGPTSIVKQRNVLLTD
jgi:hypothetical protein